MRTRGGNLAHVQSQTPVGLANAHAWRKGDPEVCFYFGVRAGAMGEFIREL